MRIVLTEDLSPRKGWLKGRSFDWERPTITAISTNLGRKTWFEPADHIETRTNRDQIRKRGASGTRAE